MANVTTDGTDRTSNSGLLITTVRVQNFRCLKSVEARLNSTTLLVGENNAGKTSFLEALHAAIGSGQRQFSEDDIWTDVEEKQAPRNRSIVIDLLIRPMNDDGKAIETFPDGSPWLELWGNGVVQDDSDRDLVAIRTQYAWSTAKGEYVPERKFLKGWANTLDDAMSIEVMERVPALTVAQTAPIALYLLDAKRDGAEDIRVRGSVWHKLVSEPGLTEEDVDDIETRLTEINDIFVSQSAVLSHIQLHLKGVGDVVNCDSNGVSITPVARRLRDLHKGMDVILSTLGAPAFPLGRQGMGTRSLASVLLFRAFTSWKMNRRKTEALHPFVAIEEPETHLHPHAQRALYGQIQSIPGQRIISTHSPYICAQADVRDFLHFGKSGTETCVNYFDSDADALSEEDLRHINRQVMNTRGDLLFSRYIILIEGETEEQAVPEFAKMRWQHHPHELGISIIGVGSKTAYTPFLRLASRFNIKWCILSDGKDTDIQSVNECLKKVGLEEHPKNNRVFRLPNQLDFEGYMAQPDYEDAVRGLILECATVEKSLNSRGREARRRELAAMSGEDLAKEMRKRGRKTYYGARIAAAFAKLPPEKQIPPTIRKLLDFVYPPVKNAKPVEKEADNVN